MLEGMWHTRIITSCRARVDVHVAHRPEDDVKIGKYATTRGCEGGTGGRGSVVG